MLRLLLLYISIFKVDTVSSEGHCIWYGECGESANGKKNCHYTGPAKPLYDDQALRILQKYCPSLYHGNGSLTCCNTDQLNTFVSIFSVPRQILYRCPACIHNFLNLFCYSTCSPHQSDSLYVNSTTPYKNSTVVDVIDYVVAKDFAFGMYNSCKNAMLPSAGDRAMSILCGRPASECNPYNLLSYIGNPDNGQAPFRTNFHIQDDPWTPTGQKIKYQPMNTSVASCETGPRNVYACQVMDCSDNFTIPLGPSQPVGPTIFGIDSCFFRMDCLKNSPLYRVQQVIISRSKKGRIVHQYPLPSVKTVNFTDMFEKSFLHQVLDLQQQIMNLTVYFNNKTITFDDLCFKSQTSSKNSCRIHSISEYWQNKESNLDKELWYPFHLYKADYLDHFLYCASNPEMSMDDFTWNMSCLASGHYPIFPWNVLRGYDARNFQNSTSFVLTFVINNYPNKSRNAAADAWEKVWINFMKNYTNPNMTISYNPQTPERECIWYGECKTSAVGSKRNCAYSGPAKPLNDDASQRLLQELCPQYYKGNGSSTCCSSGQINDLKNRVAKQRQYFRNCPSCYSYFLKVICYVMCDPHQSNSMSVTKNVMFKDNDNIEEVKLAMTEDFAKGMFDACNECQNSSSVLKTKGRSCGCAGTQCTPTCFLTRLINFGINSTTTIKLRVIN